MSRETVTLSRGRLEGALGIVKDPRRECPGLNCTGLAEILEEAIEVLANQLPGEGIQRLWEAATVNWNDPQEMFDSSAAYPGGSIRGKELYWIGVELGLIEPRDLEEGEDG